MERKRLLLITGIFIVIVVAALFFAAYFPTPHKVLKQNLYRKAFTDYPFGLMNLDVIIHYETETDGTWRRSSQASYNITVLVKPTYVNESVMSSVKVIHWEVGDLITMVGGWSFFPAESAPMDYGIDLMDFWFNQSDWCVVSKIHHPSITYYPPAPLQDQNILTYYLIIREILTDGSNNLFNFGDFFSIPISP